MTGISWLSAPDRLKASDVILSVAVSLALVLLLPEKVFLASNVDRKADVLILFAAVIAGAASAHFWRKKSTGTPDPIYIRAWWGVIAGAVCLPVCFLFRKVASEVCLAAFVFFLGQIWGHAGYRMLRR